MTPPLRSDLCPRAPILAWLSQTILWNRGDDDGIHLVKRIDEKINVLTVSRNVNRRVDSRCRHQFIWEAAPNQLDWSSK